MDNDLDFWEYGSFEKVELKIFRKIYNILFFDFRNFRHFSLFLTKL